MPPPVAVAEDEPLPDELPPEAPTDVDYFIVSRRSRDRAGLRYQRRGVDEDGNVANFVETETVMAVYVCHLINAMTPFFKYRSARKYPIYSVSFSSVVQVRAYLNSCFSTPYIFPQSTSILVPIRL
jgi:hypothetical protein